MGDITDAIAELRTAQKSNRGAPAYSRFVNRPLGRILAAAAHTWGLGPNLVTMISGAVTISGVVAIALIEPTWWSSLIVAVLLVLGYALDSADGQVARLQGRSTFAGEWLDHLLDALKIATIHSAVLISWYRWLDLDSTAWLFVPLVFQVTYSVYFFGIILTDLLRRISRLQAPDREAPVATGRTSLVYSLAVIPADYGLLCLVFLLLWIEPAFVAVYTALAAVNVLVLLVSAVRWFRSMRALEPTSA